MTSSTLRPGAAAVLLLLFAGALTAAQDSGGSVSARPTSTRASSSSSKTPLPDPALLDGSKMQAEKRPEFGMIGDFELPGDENVRNGKVGGPQKPGMQGGMQLPGAQDNQNGGGGGQQQMPQTAQSGGGGQEQNAQNAQQGGGAAGQEQTAQNGGAQGSGAPMSGPQGEAQGRQVGQMSGEAANQDASAAANKPGQVSIGDKAMRIETSQNVQGVIGEQTAASQQHEKGTGTGGKNAIGDNGNKGAERGRTMPSGL